MAHVYKTDKGVRFRVQSVRGGDTFIASLSITQEEAESLRNELNIALGPDRWRQEAMQVMEGWDECCEILELAGHPAPVGRLKYQHVAQFLLKAVHQDDA